MSGGLTIGESNRDYHSDLDHISSSALKELATRGPERFLDYMNHFRTVDQPPDAMVLGSYAHALALEPPEVLGQEFCVQDWGDARNGKGLAKWNALKEEMAGVAEIIRPSHVAQAEAMVESLRRNETARTLLEANSDIPNESSFRWTDENGLKLRCRWDRNILTGYPEPVRAIVDLKFWSLQTAGDHDLPELLTKQVVNRWAHLQAALYCEGAARLDDGLPIVHWLLITDTSPPHRTFAFDTTPLLPWGDAILRTLKREIADRRASGDWRSRWTRGAVKPQLPPWMEKQMQRDMYAHLPQTDLHTLAAEVPRGLSWSVASAEDSDSADLF